jgi:hypothetical protein
MALQIPFIPAQAKIQRKKPGVPAFTGTSGGKESLD